MDSVPAAFVDALCCQMEKLELDELRTVNSFWSSMAYTHYTKRRELLVFLDVNKEGTEVRMGVTYTDRHIYLPSTLDAKHDRIKGIYVRHYGMNLSENVSFERFKKKVFPVLRSMAFGCELDFESSKPHSENLTDIIFSGLHDCKQVYMSRIFTENYGGNCPDFIENQISLGRVKALSLRGDRWPDTIQASLESFMKSARFESLDLSGSNLTLDFDTASNFVNRFLTGVGVRNLKGKPSFTLSWLRGLYKKQQDTMNAWNRYNTLAIWRAPNGRGLEANRTFDGEIEFTAY
uniref:F-box domain-containing protein n=1 Tax=Steinernema glaseri TaxID=37863 RepID=A0A1I7YIF5_9BILA